MGHARLYCFLFLIHVLALPVAGECRGARPDLVNAEAFLQRAEGFRSQAYPDGRAGFSIGYGHHSKNRPAGEITRAEAKEMLRHDLAQARGWARDDCATFDSQPATIQFVLTSLAFQCGRAGLAKFMEFLHFVDTGEYLLAGERLRRSKLYSQCHKRTEELAQLVENVE